jgi:hypothetical protein
MALESRYAADPVVIHSAHFFRLNRDLRNGEVEALILPKHNVASVKGHFAENLSPQPCHRAV